MGRKKILAILTAISLVGFASYSFFTKETQNLQKEECVAQETNINNEIQNKIDEKEATKIVKNFLTQITDENTNIYSFVDYELSQQFVKTPTSNSQEVLDIQLSELQQKALENKEFIDNIEVMEFKQIDNILVVDCFWNDEKDKLYFIQKDNDWKILPFGIKNISPIKKAIVMQGYLPMKITGNIADTIDGNKKVFLFFGTMKTALASWEKHFPLEIVVKDGEKKDSVTIYEKDLKKLSKNNYLSDKPMYIEFEVKNVDEIKEIEFNNLFVKNNMEDYKNRELNNKIKIKLN